MLLGSLVADELALTPFGGPLRAPTCVRFFVRRRAIIICEAIGPKKTLKRPKHQGNYSGLEESICRLLISTNIRL